MKSRPRQRSARARESSSETSGLRTRGRWRWRAVVAVALTVLVFGGVVAAVSFDLRGMWRAQVLRREAEVLGSVAQMQRAVVAQNAAGLGLAANEEILAVALDTARLRGVLAVRLFNEHGEFLDAVPAEVAETQLQPDELARIAADKPVARYHPQFLLRQLFLQRDDAWQAPLLEVNVKLAATDSRATGAVIVQYWIDGSSVAGEFSELDHRIEMQAGAAFFAGALLITGSLAWAFRQLDRANRLLQAHAEDLSRANRELAQSARTSAIGAITAHLMHGLRNPLAGLEDFVASQAGGVSADASGEWADARESTLRLRSMVNEVQTVLSDVHTGADFDVTVGELCAGLRDRLQPLATRRDVRLEFSGTEEPVLPARTAGLAGLILANLTQNAIEASPLRASVRVTATSENGVVVFRVSDEGGGLPEAVAADPFRPRRSTKAEGAGIGLAISSELARHAGGELVLASNGPGGATFALKLPVTALRTARGVT